MNGPLRRVGFVALLLFGLLMVNANYVQVIQARELTTRPGNNRLLIDEYSRQRGAIVVDGRAVAASVKTDDRLQYLRRYANGPLYAPVTGFYSFVYGATGIERASNPFLTGTDDRLFVRRLLDLVTGAEPQGGSVELTLDPRAQRAAYRGLEGRRGAVVALDPSSGAILALVSSPSYDPNLLSSHDGRQIRSTYAKLDEDPDKPMLNRAVSRTYPPGSTFKIVTAAAALESGRYTPESRVPGPARLDLPQTTAALPNFDNRQCSAGSDTTTLATALERSCNTTFGAIGLALGDDALRDQAEKFGFDTEITVPLQVAGSAFPEDPDAPQTAQSAIGQFDVRATPLQMAMVAAGVANRGRVMAPYLVSSLRAPDLSVVERAEPTELARAMSPQTAQTLTRMLVGVVEQGTGSNARISGIDVAGKTGTAQQGGGRPPHAWFVSFAPADDPQVAVAVVVEDGGGESEVSGNRLAAPIAREVMRAVLGQ